MGVYMEEVCIMYIYIYGRGRNLSITYMLSFKGLDRVQLLAGMYIIVPHERFRGKCLIYICV